MLRFGPWISPIGQNVKGLVPRLLLWEMVEFLSTGVLWEVPRSVRVCPLKGTTGPQPLSLLLLPHDVSKFAPLPTPATLCCLVTGPKQQGQSIMYWNPQICETKQSFSFYKLIVSEFHYGKRKELAHQPWLLITPLKPPNHGDAYIIPSP